MSWKCPDCGKNLKRKGNHPATHESDEIDFNVVEEFLSYGPPLGGEIGRLRAKAEHDQSRDWTSVYNVYAKVTKGDGPQHKRAPLEGAANTRRERQALSALISENRRREQW